MRKTLALVCAAVTSMVAIAFLIPLAVIVRDMAKDRAFTSAQLAGASIEPVLAVTTDPAALQRAIAGTAAGAAGRLAIDIGGTLTGGPQHASAADLNQAASQARPFTAPVPGGYVVLQPAALGANRIAITEVYVPGAEVSRGVAALGDGDLTARSSPTGPPELVAAGHAFNLMAERLSRLINAERVMAADLPHRLRTPLTALRMNAAALGPGRAADDTRLAVDRMEKEVDLIIRAARRPAPEEPSGCDAAAVLKERLAFWSALAEDQGRPCHLTGVDRPVRVPVPRTDLAAAADALIGNVFRYTAEGTEFAVTLHSGNGVVLIFFADAGPGIADPDAALQRGSSGAGSTGLGLDIARRVAESTGGTLIAAAAAVAAIITIIAVSGGGPVPVRDAADSATTLTVSYTEGTGWGTGYSGQYTITNGGTTAVTGWTLAFRLPSGTSLSSLWNGSFTDSGGQVTVTNDSWDATIAAGGSVSVGFVTRSSGQAGQPADCRINGASCSGGSVGTAPASPPATSPAASPSAPAATSPSASPSPSASMPAVASGTTAGFAPYVDTSLYPPFSLVSTAKQTRVKQFNLAFVVSGGGCIPKWGGVTAIGSDPVAAQIG